MVLSGWWITPKNEVQDQPAKTSASKPGLNTVWIEAVIYKPLIVVGITTAASGF